MFVEFEKRCAELAYDGFYYQLIQERNFASETVSLFVLLLLCNACGVKYVR